MSHPRLSEDGSAIVLGALLLALACLAFLILPAAPAAPSALTTLLQHLGIGLGRWDLNPLVAFSGTGLRGFVGLTLALGLLYAALGTTDVRAGSFLRGFALLSLVALGAWLLGNQNQFRGYGFGYALWAIVLGLCISNVWGVPAWLRPALQHELYVKTGLVLLGAEVLFGKILAIGLPGIFVAWVTTPIVLVTTYWFGQRILKIESKTLNITVSADMSVCGVSAAIATEIGRAHV